MVVVLRGRIFGIGTELEEAAMDLGARPLDALRRVMLPVLAPTIFVGFMMPMLIYSSGRTAPNPALNATATLMLVISLAAMGLGFGGMRTLARRLGVQGEGSDVARFRL